MSNEEIAAAIADVENRAKSNTHRLDKMEERQDNLDKLVAAVAGVQKDLEHTQGDVAEIKGDVKAMMGGPQKTLGRGYRGDDHRHCQRVGWGRYGPDYQIIWEVMIMKNWRIWLKAAGVRAIKTVAQTAVATIGTSALLAQVDWIMVASASALAGLLSLLTSVAGLPEVEG